MLPYVIRELVTEAIEARMRKIGRQRHAIGVLECRIAESEQTLREAAAILDGTAPPALSRGVKAE